MKEKDNNLILGEMRGDLKHILLAINEIKDNNDSLSKRVNALENWRNGLAVASATIGTMLVGLGVTVKSALSALIHHP
jgi:hypothetical protein